MPKETIIVKCIINHTILVRVKCVDKYVQKRKSYNTEYGYTFRAT